MAFNALSIGSHGDLALKDSMRSVVQDAAIILMTIGGTDHVVHLNRIVAMLLTSQQIDAVQVCFRTLSGQRHVDFTANKLTAQIQVKILKPRVIFQLPGQGRHMGGTDSILLDLVTAQIRICCPMKK